jgi:hypothetical protein
MMNNNEKQYTYPLEDMTPAGFEEVMGVYHNLSRAFIKATELNTPDNLSLFRAAVRLTTLGAIYTHESEISPTLTTFYNPHFKSTIVFTIKEIWKFIENMVDILQEKRETKMLETRNINKERKNNND